MSGLAMVLFRADLQGRAERLGTMAEDERRRVAVRAAQTRDADALWDLMEAHVVLRGKSGARVSEHTLRAYRAGLVQFLAWAGDRVDLLRPGRGAGESYVRWLEGQYTPRRNLSAEDAASAPKHLKAPTVRARLVAAKGLYAALRWAGATEARPFEDVRAAPDREAPHRKRRPYSDADVAKLLEAADPEETVLVLLGAHAGLRISEMTGLTWRGVDFGEGVLRVTGKGGSVDEVHMSPRLSGALTRWRVLAPPDVPYVVLHRSRWYVGDKMKALCARAGVTWAKRQVHGLRHTAGTKMLQATNNIVAVQEHLRHRSLNSTGVYAHYAKEGLGKVLEDW